MSDCIKFTSIEQFRNVRRNVEWKAQYQGQDENDEPIMNRLAKMPTITFIGTEKIHGGNLSIVIDQNQCLTCQSRERIITPEDDCYGFAKFVEKNKERIINDFPHNTVIYGEWAGKGIQNKVAVCELEKFWVIFAVKTINGGYVDISNWATPDDIRIFNIYDNKIWTIDIDFESPGDVINQINAWTLEVEEESPFAAKFGVKDIGEGIVFHAVDQSYPYDKFSFKSKGDKHSGSRVKKLATVDVEKMKNIESFVDKHVNEERLMQGYNYLHENKKFDYERSLGEYLRWVFNDIMKEEADELAASGLSQKELGGAVSKRAKIWYFEKIKSI